MKKTFLYLSLSLGMLSLGVLTACGDDDPADEPVIQKPDTGGETGDTTAVTPTPDPVSGAQGWPAQYGGVMLQGFYWDSYDDSQWTALEAMAPQLHGTFDLVWLPQSGYCGGQSMGYDDLYWFDNYNSSFGTEQQLRSLISTYKGLGIGTLADVVINHRRNLSNWVDFPRETYKGVTYEMLSTDICANDDGGKTKTWASQNGYELSKNNDTGEGWDGMRDLDHKSENVQAIVKAYLDFLKNDLGYAGFRYDMVKGYSAQYTALYNASAKPDFSVGECWDGTNTIKNWIDGTKAGDQPQSAAFDFQFRYTVRNAMNNANYQRLTQQNDGNWPLVSNSLENGKYRRWAVTFVENHDTEHRSNGEVQDPLKKDTLAANAYMLAMPGTPCVFFKHWQAYPSEIKAMVAARKLAGITNESTYQVVRTSSACCITSTQVGGEDRLLLAVGNTAGQETFIDATKWSLAVKGYHFEYYLPNTLETAYADLPTGTYEGTQTVTLRALTAADGAQLVYTTDGTNPTAASTAVPSGYQLTVPAGGSVTLRVGLLVGGSVSGVATRTYDVREKASEQPVEIPSFCTVATGETCAFFEAPATWTQAIMCWAWIDNGDNFTGGTWPGAPCTLLGTAANGNQVWKWTYSGPLSTRPQKIIFSNSGAPQTADLLFENGGYYNRDGLKGVVGQ